MLNLVLVDDRSDIVLGIAHARDWAARGIAFHGFFNGADALAYCLDNPVDLVIADIRMPFMTGLELLAALREHKKETRVVMLTGYADFSYAQEALRLGAVEYLTKPVRIENIEELIEREKAVAEQRRSAQAAQLAEWQRYQRSLPALHSQWLESLRTQTPDEASLKRQFDELDLALQPRRLLAVLLTLAAADGDEPLASEELNLTRYAAANIGRELVRAHYPCECVEVGSDQLAFLLNYPETERPLSVYYHVGECFERLAAKCEELLKVSAAGGIGCCAEHAEELQTSLQTAKRALDQNFYTKAAEPPRIFTAIELPEDTHAWEQQYPAALQDKVIQLLRRGDLTAAQQTMDELFARLAQLTQADPAALKERLLAFLLRIFHECEMERYLHVSSAIQQFQSKRSLAALQEWFGCLTAYLKDRISEDASQTAAGVYKVKRYIDDHCAEAISLKSMAALAYVSPAYLSFSFKEVLGVNFNEYLTNARMEQAKRLLADRKYHVYEVCEMVGYKDKKYFSELFKKHTGVFPKEWK